MAVLLLLAATLAGAETVQSSCNLACEQRAAAALLAQR